MSKKIATRKPLIQICIFLFFIFLFTACENHRYDRDKRQIIAKDEIQNKLQRATAYDVTGFSEDTIEITGYSDFKKLIRYSLDIEFMDSNKVLQKKKGLVLFAPDGQSVISSKITDR